MGSQMNSFAQSKKNNDDEYVMIFALPLNTAGMCEIYIREKQKSKQTHFI